MKRLTFCLVAMAICIASDGEAFGQTPQSNECNPGNVQSDVIYQPTQWNSCQSHNHRGGHRIANPCYESRGSRCTSFWTRPLFSHGYAAKCCGNKAFPDAGWSAPAHLPVNYDGVWYGSYLPQHAYGTPGGGFIANYPTVYQPTDTTQLGYYYNKVPTWQSRSDMIPGVPNPSNFHTRVNPIGGTCFHGYHGATFGQINYGPVPASCPNCNPVHESPTPSQNSSPNGQQVVRASQPQRQGLLGGFRLASMKEVFE